LEERRHLLRPQRLHHVPPRLGDRWKAVQAEPLQEVPNEEAVVVKGGLLGPLVFLDAPREALLHPLSDPLHIVVVSYLRYFLVSDDLQEVLEG